MATGLYSVVWRIFKAGKTAPLTEMAKMRVIVVGRFGTEDLLHKQSLFNNPQSR